GSLFVKRPRDLGAELRLHLDLRRPPADARQLRVDRKSRVHARIIAIDGSRAARETGLPISEASPPLVAVDRRASRGHPQRGRARGGGLPPLGAHHPSPPAPPPGPAPRLCGPPWLPTGTQKATPRHRTP